VATVRASCPTCGDVKLTTRDVQVQAGYTSALNSYSFLCPSCRLLVNKEATELIMETLVAAGVRVICWTRPAELDELKLGPRITHDDLLAFHCPSGSRRRSRSLAPSPAAVRPEGPESHRPPSGPRCFQKSAAVRLQSCSI
jgi:hypothetical protein